MKNILNLTVAVLLAIGTAAIAQETATAPEAPAEVTEAAQLPPPPMNAPDGENQQARGARPPRGGARQGMPNAKQLLQQLNKDAKAILALYDADKDGKLNEAERAKMDAEFAIAAKLQRYVRSKAILDAVDADKDMVISEKEAKGVQKFMRKAMRERMGRGNGDMPPPPERIKDDGEAPADLPPPPPPAEEKAPAEE